MLSEVGLTPVHKIVPVKMYLLLQKKCHREFVMLFFTRNKVLLFAKNPIASFKKMVMMDVA